MSTNNTCTLCGATGAHFCTGGQKQGKKYELDESTNQAETAEEVEKLFKVIGETRTGDMNVEDWVYPEWQTLINSIRSLQARNKELEVSSEDNASACESAVKKWNELEAENKLLREEWERMRVVINNTLKQCVTGNDIDISELFVSLGVCLSTLKFSPYQK